jgi:hypothetical protein
MASYVSVGLANTLEDLMRWNVTPGPGYPAAYSIAPRLARLTPARRQHAIQQGNALYAAIQKAVTDYIATKQKYVYPMKADSTGVLYFRDVYRKACAMMFQYLEQTRNEDAILALVLMFKNGYHTNSFPEAIAKWYTILRNGNQPDAVYGCGSDADVRYRITDQACEVLEVSYGKPSTVESPCSKNTFKYPALPFPQSRDRDDRTHWGGGGGGGGDRVTRPAAAAPPRRVAVPIYRGGKSARRRSRTKSPSRTPRRRAY